MTPQERRAFLEFLPFVKRLKVSQPCEGLRWGKMPLKAIYRHGPGNTLEPTGTEKYRCKNAAYWKFTALKKSRARDGVYCMSHLYSAGIGHDMDEQARLNRWWKKYNDIQTKT